MIFVTKELRSC